MDDDEELLLVLVVVAAAVVVVVVVVVVEEVAAVSLVRVFFSTTFPVVLFPKRASLGKLIGALCWYILMNVKEYFFTSICFEAASDERSEPRGNEGLG